MESSILSDRTKNTIMNMHSNLICFIIICFLGHSCAANKAITSSGQSAHYTDVDRKGTFVIDKEIDLEWARIPHFYYDYYVYQYATGYSAAIALSRRILKEGEPAVKDYLNFLSGGCSADPITLLRGAGVDMATTQPITEALKLFDELITEMEQLMEA